MSRMGFRREKERGLGLYLFVLISLFILPTLLIMLKNGMYQNKNALRDRNLKTSREMAESTGADFMNIYSDDWRRDPFDNQFSGTHNSPTYLGLGNVTSVVNAFRSSGTARILIQGNFTKGNSLARATKGIEALYFWSSDALKFDFVWNFNVDMRPGGNVSPAILGIANPMDQTVFIDGDFDAGDNPATLSGLWVVKGEFRMRPPVGLNKAVIYCQSFVDEGDRIFGNSIINQYGPNPDNFVPILKVLPLGEKLTPADITYYCQRSSTEIFITPGGNWMRVQLSTSNQVTLTEFDNANNQIGVSVRDYFPTAGVSSTASWTLALSSGDVEVQASSITRPITLVVREGNVRVAGDITYVGSPVATAGLNFALITDGNLTIGSTATLTLSGFYGTSAGTISLDGPGTINLTGTLFGPISQYNIGAGNTLNISADRQLARFPPPKFPRRPRLLMWDYVP